MFAVGNVLVTDDVLDAPFSCHLGVCKGGCCVQGDSGAPLDPDEREELERIIPQVRSYLRPEAIEIIDKNGAWEEIEPQRYATACVGNAACVFVTYEGPVAKCAIEKAYFEGKIAFRKPVSCHLYPLRAERFGDVEALNYEQVPLCRPAVQKGVQNNIQLHDFLRESLVRKYGEAWYEQFRLACEERREELGMQPYRLLEE